MLVTVATCEDKHDDINVMEQVKRGWCIYVRMKV